MIVAFIIGITTITIRILFGGKQGLGLLMKSHVEGHGDLVSTLMSPMSPKHTYEATEPPRDPSYPHHSPA